MTGPRVVSLVPSVTETLLAWGVEPVAVTRFCEHPELPAVGGTKNPDIPAIVALSPDLVVMDREENTLVDADALRSEGITLHVTHVTSLADVRPCLHALAVAVGKAPPAVDRAAPSRRPPIRAWVPIWRRPWMTINGATYGASLLAALGVENVYADAAVAYPEVTLEDAAARRPDVVLVPSEPYSFTERHRQEIEAVAPMVAVDGKDLFWWGERTAGALGRLAEVVRNLGG